MDGIQLPRDISGIKDTIGSFECVGNPFCEGSANFIILDTKVMISAEWIKAAKETELLGIELSHLSMKSRLENQSDSGRLENQSDSMYGKKGNKHVTVKDGHCRTICSMCLAGNFFYHGKMTQQSPGHLPWKAFLHAVSNKGNLRSLAIPGVKL